MNQAKRTVQKRDLRQKGGYRISLKVAPTKRQIQLAEDTTMSITPDMLEKALANRRKALDGYPYKPLAPTKSETPKTLRQQRMEAMKEAGHLKGDNRKFLFNPIDKSYSMV